MPSITVRDMSEQTLSSLKTRARCNHRSLNGEILFIFDWVADHGISPDSIDGGGPDPAVQRQKDGMEGLIGSWGDPRNANEIISEIRKARTMGRAVSL